MTRDRSPGFLPALFDLSFNTYITSRLIRGIYRLVIAININLAIGWIALTLELPWWVGWGLKAAMFVLAPVCALIVIAFSRIILEYLIVIFQIDEKLRMLTEHAGRTIKEKGGDS